MKCRFNWLLLVAGLLSSSVFAGQQTISFSVGETEGTFYCSVPKNVLTTAKVNIDTHSVKIKGFCSGQQYVTKEGHVAGFPVQNLNKYYFKVKKDWLDNGSVTISVPSKEVTCKEGRGDGRQEYGSGGYC